MKKIKSLIIILLVSLFTLMLTQFNFTSSKELVHQVKDDDKKDYEVPDIPIRFSIGNL